jgi:putative holliday junction resolvase
MKILGIDYGTKRIGLAVSDGNHTLAFPKEILINDKNCLEKLAQVIEDENIGEIVIGESMDFSGNPNPVSARIEAFISELKNKFNLPIHKQKEFLTSTEARKPLNTKAERNTSQAHSRQKEERSKKVDGSAAALILQRYLDRINVKIAS